MFLHPSIYSTSGSGAPRLKQKVIFSFLLCGLASWIACGKSNPNGGGGGTTTILPHRALISNLTSSRVDIADTSRDLIVTTMSGDLPGKLLLSNDKKFTVSLSPIDNSVDLFLNARQTGIGAANLAGASQSIVLTVDNGLLLGAVPTEAGPLGQAPGAVDVVTVAITTTAPGACPKGPASVGTAPRSKPLSTVSTML